MDRTLPSKIAPSPRLHQSSAARMSRSRFSISGRSVQSAQFVTKTQYNSVERYGLPLPVQVTEVLTFAEHTRAVSVQISPTGWAWVVCSRRLLIWQWKLGRKLDSANTSIGPLSRPRTHGQQCRELTLPQSDLSHKAELVAVFIGEGNPVPSCIAVSPEGQVRYWPSIAQEGISIVESVDLQGQECDSLINLYPLGFILATTTCSLVLVQVNNILGRNGLLCRPLKSPSGWLGGIGRKMSSLIFGAVPSGHGIDTKLIKVLAVPKGPGWALWVLASHGLQRWALQPGEAPESLIYECDVARIVRDAFHERMWDGCPVDPSELDTWVLDIQSSNDSITLLTAAVNMQGSPRLHYAFANINGEILQAPTQLVSFCPLKVSAFYSEDSETETLGLRFLLNGTQAYLYSPRGVTAVSAVQPNEEYDLLDFVASNDRLLGGTVVQDTVLFFTQIHGLLCVTPGDFANSSITSEVVGSHLDTSSAMTDAQAKAAYGNLTLYDLDPEDLVQASEDHMAQLKAAFLLHLKGNAEACVNILQQLFPFEQAGEGAELDRVVVCAVKDLVTALPAGDPRWADRRSDKGANLGGSASMQILQQLQDKQLALQLFINFLKATHLWDRFSLISHHNNIMATAYVLEEYAEKIIASIVIRQLQNCHPELLENAIRIAVAGEDVPPGLLPQDLFYVQINRVHKLIQALVHSVEELVHSEENTTHIVNSIIETNTVVLTILQEVIKKRKENADMFSPSRRGVYSEYLPWTTAMGKHGLRQSLLMQHSLTLRHGARVCDVSQRALIYEQLVNLADMVLDGLQSHLESAKTKDKYPLLLQQYESQRSDLIYPLVDDKQYELAAVLAEKYCDFQILVQICDLTQNKKRLDEYMERFKEQNFARFICEWHIREKKGGALLNHFRSKPAELNVFLHQHPTLAWVNQALNGDREDACNTLMALADQEQNNLARKKTMLSLAKIAALCSPLDKSSTVEHIDCQLNIVQLQEELPLDVLAACAFDVNNMLVLPVRDIINLYISEENSKATETDFKHALDLLPFIPDPLERSQLTHLVWVAALRRDLWKCGQRDNPVEIAMNTVFFKTIEYCFIHGQDIDDVLPALEQLLEAEELGDLGSEKSFQYLLKVGYEHVLQTHKNQEDE